MPNLIMPNHIGDWKTRAKQGQYHYTTDQLKLECGL